MLPEAEGPEGALQGQRQGRHNQSASGDRCGCRKATYRQPMCNRGRSPGILWQRRQHQPGQLITGTRLKAFVNQGLRHLGKRIKCIYSFYRVNTLGL